MPAASARKSASVAAAEPATWASPIAASVATPKTTISTPVRESGRQRQATPPLTAKEAPIRTCRTSASGTADLPEPLGTVASLSATSTPGQLRRPPARPTMSTPPAARGARAAPARRVRSGVARDQQLEQRLLRVTAILRLVPDALASAVEDVRRDLLARMRREAVQGEGAGLRAVQQRVVEPVGGELAPARLGGRLVVAHADPHVGVDRVGALDRGLRLAHELRPEVVLELEARRRRHGHLEAGEAADDRQRAGDVVAVAHVRQPAPAQ